MVLFSGLIALSVSAMLLWHNMAFWTDMVGNTGIAWALVMEAVALFLWYRGNRLMALLASLIVITGPLYLLSQPVLSERIEKGVDAALIVESRAEIASLEASLAQYQSNSSRRPGWADRIDGTRQRLDAARAELRGLLQQGRGKRQAFQQVIVVGLQVAAVILMMVAQILAVADVRKRFGSDTRSAEKAASTDPGLTKAPGPIPATLSPKPLNSTPAPFDRLSALSKKVSEALEQPGFDGKKGLLAQACGVRPADISLLLQHDRRQREGKETASLKAIEKVERYVTGRESTAR